MPLAFPSKNHGTIAFGFFNIETDLLLLENVFFFADRFCQAVSRLWENSVETQDEVPMDGFQINDSFRIGNLHGAIQGIDLSGFIGATYQTFPFPLDPKGFKQKPHGAQHQLFMKDLILKFGKELSIRIHRDKASSLFYIHDYLFEEKTFRSLIDYVKKGGYPGWQDEMRPDYVAKMMGKITEKYFTSI